MSKDKESCTKACVGCPLAFTDESEQIGNYGCLPTPYDVLRYKVDMGHNWSCHETTDGEGDGLKICRGLVSWSREHDLDLDFTYGGFLDYADWYHLGEDEMLQKAEGRLSSTQLEGLKTKLDEAKGTCLSCQHFSFDGYCRNGSVMTRNRRTVKASTPKCDEWELVTKR